MENGEFIRAKGVSDNLAPISPTEKASSENPSNVTVLVETRASMPTVRSSHAASVFKKFTKSPEPSLVLLRGPSLR